MYEPTVLEYVRAASQLDEPTFCKQFNSAVLVSIDGELGQAFQDTKTRLSNPGINQGERATNPTVQGLAHVLSVSPGPGHHPDLFTIGRSEENDLVLNHETVSASHAVLARGEDGLCRVLKDLASTNGTTVNKIQLDTNQVVELKDADKLAIGEVRFLFYTPEGFYKVLKPQPK